MDDIQFFGSERFPIEMHKTRIVQRLRLPAVDERLRAIGEAGNNTFLLKNVDIFLDMLSDSGVNAMSDQQLASMMVADDSYAGSSTFTRLETKVREIFHKEYFLPAHQGRACEHILARVFLKPGDVVPMNYHFTTAKAHITLQGASILELFGPEAIKTTSDHPFKGNLPPEALEKAIAVHGKDKIPFVRVETGTNLIGGQPHSLENLRAVHAVCRAHGIPLVLDASLLADNLYFIKKREAACQSMEIRDIARAMADCADIIYFSARKLGHARGGGICTADRDLYLRMRDMVPLFEGFLTYGGMSVREIEAIAVGLEETMDYHMINQGPEFIAYMVDELTKRGVPVVTPAGGLGCHLDATRFLPHLPQSEYPAGALAAAVYLASGARGMERGTLSEQREPDGSERFAEMELLRLALPRRVFTLSQVKFIVDRLEWLYRHRDMVGGLKFLEEPKVLRFFLGRLGPVSDWQEKLAAKFKADLGNL